MDRGNPLRGAVIALGILLLTMGSLATLVYVIDRFGFPA